MKQKPLLYLSAGINLALVIIVVLGARKSEDDHPDSGPKWTPVESDESTTTSRPLLGEPGALPVDASETIPTFRWSQIESENYAKYIKNLRSVGCPESTIRDIVEADINVLYEPQYLGLLTQAQTYDSWRNGPNDLHHQESLRSQIVALDEERLGHLRGLLGEGYSSNKNMASLSHQDLIARSSIGFLNPELQDAVSSIMDDFDDRERQIRLELSSVQDREQLNRELAENKQARRDSLGEVLNEEELMELDIRDSHAATALRNKLRGFDVSESEFRELFAKRQAYEGEQGETPDFTDPEKMAERALARQELEAGYRETLGEDRYTDLQRQGDSDWQALLALEETQGLNREIMGVAYDLRKEASRTLMLEMGKTTLTETEIAALTEVTKAQYQREMTALVGDDGFNSLGELNQRNPIRISTANGDGQTSIMLLGEPVGAQFDVAQEIVRGILPQVDGAHGAATQHITIFQSTDSTPVSRPVEITAPTP
ncbi:hypothetical protein N8494_00410 [bacterium]|jgi:hypothetical protein|nr:hypothetical protein [Verrucomicrobiota bacterium]MDA7497157.1 hypothetical protein [bacterium]MDA7510313.1 hypothetical protein [Verrucomicrobiota bacterium]MDA7633315.1 hypothetical protein [bacterium]